MRKLYFLRHGEPAFPNGHSVCLGRKELPLSALGRLQAAVAAHEFRQLSLEAVFCSPLLRAKQTAKFLSQPYQIVTGLREIDTGEWDGLSFQEIRSRWPELYEQRGKHPFLSFPKGEPQSLALLHFIQAVQKAAEETSKDILFVTHSGILSVFFSWLSMHGTREALSQETLARLLAKTTPADIRKPRYGSISTLTETDGNLQLETWGQLPHPIPDRAFCYELLEAAKTPAPVRRHSEAVADRAASLAFSLEQAGYPLQRNRILAACLLHDIARTEKNHAIYGAGLLEKLGYPELAGPLRTHHDLPPDAPVDEAALVFLADKLVQEDQSVSLRERFERSAAKCVTPESKNKHAKRYRTALALAKKVNEISRKNTIEI